MPDDARPSPELRFWRNSAHKAFDALWHKKRTKAGDRHRAHLARNHKASKYDTDSYSNMNRTAAYRWLACAMELTEDECHIRLFDVDQCKKVIEICGGTA